VSGTLTSWRRRWRRNFKMGAGNLDGCGNCVKWSLVVVNFFIMLGGIAAISVGVWTYWDKAFMEVLLRNNLYMSATYIMIGCGCFAIALSILGCVGAIKEIKAGLLSYFVFMLVMFVVLVVAGILGYVFRNQISGNLKPEMMFTITKYDPNKPRSPITAAWDNTQKHLECCGLSMQDEYEDRPWLVWRINNKVNSGEADSRVPESCCRTDEFGRRMDCTGSNPVDETKIHRSDCYAVGLEFVQEHALVLASAAIAIAGTLISGLVFSISLFKLIE